MTLLIISPDYASHLLPLATIGTAWRDAGERVVVATGPATADIVASFGYERVNLQLGKGSNPGTIRAEDQPKGEDDALRGFFDATRHGMVETLAFQAEARLSDLMWEPVRVGREVLEVVRSVSADAILVDHLAFSARLAMDAAGVTYADVVLGHPSALPVDGELYGFPPAWPAAFTPDAAAVARLWELCARVDASFTAEWNAALAELNPAAAPSVSAFAEHGRTLLFNYPAALSTPRDGAVFLGSAIREEAPDADVDAWLASNDEPFVYVSFGSFLSVRADVLQRVADALAAVGVRAAIATGESTLERIPAGWLVRGFLPQVRLMSRAAVAVTHGGNNSVTEALTFGLPLLVLPFSTDQFAGAAAIEKAGYGLALAPNDASVDELAEAMRDLIARAPMPTAQTAGPAIAYSAVAYSAVAGSSASTP
jgi:zeaxanthin glucosyltransferase